MSPAMEHHKYAEPVVREIRRGGFDKPGAHHPGFQPSGGDQLHTANPLDVLPRHAIPPQYAGSQAVEKAVHIPEEVRKAA